MKKLINKLISRRLIYVLLAVILVATVIIITAKKFEDVKLAKDELENKQMQIASVEEEKLDYTTITSRGSDETRKSTKEQEEISESSEENSTEEESSNKNSSDQNSSKEETSNKENLNNEDSENEEDTTTTYISIEDVKISKDMDLTVRTGLSRKDFIKLIAGVKYDTSGFFEENAGLIYDLCEEYSINEIFFCGLISAESGWEIAENHRRTYNYISLMSNGKLIQYSSVENGLEVAAQKLHNNYLTPGGKFYHGKTLSGVKTNFCPSSSTWVELVYGRMKQIIQ